ncbi:unnamed protein product [Symbiodinium natans]|uniref:Importin subunit alpha n=1 Tax=Symbiodinium natans TaxID=878477 RepID=A0A812UCF5_9DINO|nr:unnamed protein product [Symbiodinium natans]
MEYQIDAATHLRKILSVERDPPIDKVLTLGVAPRLLELSQQMDAPKLQFETLWAILNIVSGDVHQTQAIVDLDAVPIITTLLRDCTNADVLEQGVWALGNIAGPARGAFEAEAQVLKVLENTTKPLSDQLEGRQEVLTDALWTVSYVSDGTDRYIQAVLAAWHCQVKAQRAPCSDFLAGVDYLIKSQEPIHAHSKRVLKSEKGQETPESAAALLKWLELVQDNDREILERPRVQETCSTSSSSCHESVCMSSLVFIWSDVLNRKRSCGLYKNSVKELHESKKICTSLAKMSNQQVLRQKSVAARSREGQKFPLDDTGVGVLGFFGVLANAARDAEHAVKKEVAFALANASEKKSMATGMVDAGCLEAMQAMLDSHDPKLQDLSVVFATNICEAVQARKAEGEESGRWTCFEAVRGWLAILHLVSPSLSFGGVSCSSTRGSLGRSSNLSACPKKIRSPKPTKRTLRRLLH